MFQSQTEDHSMPERARIAMAAIVHPLLEYIASLGNPSLFVKDADGKLPGPSWFPQRGPAPYITLCYLDDHR